MPIVRGQRHPFRLCTAVFETIEIYEVATGMRWYAYMQYIRNQIWIHNDETALGYTTW